MFWGLIMEPERRYTQKVKKSFHISMAALDLGSSDTEPAQIMCSYDGRNYLLCTLQKPNLLQCTLDLEFAAGTEVSFTSNGKAHIHLTGYLTDFDDDGPKLEDLMEEAEDEEVVEEEEVAEVSKGKKKKRNHVEKNAPPSKKAKLLNGSAEEGEEEESDDPDYDEVEEEEADSEEGGEESDDGEEGEEEDDDDDEDDEVDEEEAEEPEPVTQKLSKKDKKKLNQETNGEQKNSKKQEQPQKKQKQVLKGGVVVEDLTEGSGPPAKIGKFITVYYEGRLQKNNKMFDSTNKGPGFKFRLGVGEVIKGWDTGMVGMKVGGVRKIICPPHTAYGAKGSPPAIPPNSTLVFTVTLKKVN